MTENNQENLNQETSQETIQQTNQSIPSPYQQNEEEKQNRIKIEQEISDIIRNDIYPYILENFQDIEKANQFVSSIAMNIGQAGQIKLAAMKVKELELVEILKKANHPDSNKWIKILEILDDKSLLMAQRILQDIAGDLELFAREYMMKVPLKDIKTEYPPYVPPQEPTGEVSPS